ncbi:hypothetical protein GW17_00043720 [Ensete ventricosum]|nr:hypothetical protein GW17_00043720 [Ensete ventricosum]
MDPWSVGILKQNTEGTQRHTDTGGVRDLPSAPRHFNAAHVFFITSVPIRTREGSPDGRNGSNGKPEIDRSTHPVPNPQAYFHVRHEACGDR